MLDDPIIELPTAPPELYLRWVAHWRLLERTCPERVRAGHPASYAWGEVAAFVSMLASTIERQASEAKANGAVASPRIAGRRRLLVMAAPYMRRVGARALIAADLQVIRDEVIEAIEHQALAAAVRNAA